MQVEDLGLIDYKKAWDYQEEIHSQILKNRTDNGNAAVLLLCEHPHVFTLGKNGSENNLLINQDLLEKRGATFYKIDRGGDITYHGPGQLVGYPIIDLTRLHLGVKEYVHKLEQVIIDLLIEFNIIATRLDGATGVWLDKDIPGRARKICAMGIRVSRGVTMHGFALNVNADLSFFNLINPCGFTDKGVTSIQKELGEEISMQAIKDKFILLFEKEFSVN
ncbi:MAG: lipoyl(octanoyl) transferase LipB [Bacteroidota bacterium]